MGCGTEQGTQADDCGRSGRISSSYAACTELVDLRTNLAAHTVNLSYALLALAAHVVQIHAGRQSAAHHLEVAHFADMRLHRCLDGEVL